MKKLFIICLTLFFTVSVASQELIDWTPEFNISLSDFQSPATNVGQTMMNTIHVAISMSFGYNMSNIEFALTKNFNSKVTNTFQPSASYIIATDSQTAEEMVVFSQLLFNVSELYARKFRKELYDLKKFGTNPGDIKTLFNELQHSFQKDNAHYSQITTFGKERELTNEINEQILDQINELNEFCQTCTPKKKKRK